ncbi:MAG: 23S rRNA (uracil-5-)-methyltransferase RumA [Gemmatimonadales bacterium]|nr:MAG: 23S rRNA (uracil-5-)-methyltransferase RumA [Gemmatimonadales bacterium]
MVRVRIERLAAGGDGVGRLEDGMVVFVPRAAPGDLAEVEVWERKPRFARARLVRVLEPGPGRVDPLCVHYVADRCGGCQFQHLAAEVQLQAKASLVGDALRRIGKREVGDPAVVPSPAEWRYRTKITLAVSNGIIGLHRYDRPEEVFELGDCLIARESLMGLWRRLQNCKSELPRGVASVALKEDRSGGLHLVVSGGEPPWEPEPLVRALGDRVSVWWQPARGAARVVSGNRRGFPALAFEQINPELAGRIREQAVQWLGEVEGRVVWDLYCGVGDTAFLLVQRGARVYAVDADRQAIEWARSEYAARSGAVEFMHGLVEESLHRLPEPDRVVANPPRRGMHALVTGALEGWARSRRGSRDPIRLCYISCDPATLARDLARLPSFKLLELKAFDLFPQTCHVETVALLATG